MSSLVSEGFRAKLKTLKSNGRIELTEDVATGVARLNINDPAKRNCISGEMMLELENAVETLEHWSHIKAVLMCGEGSFLCSGANLTSMKAISAPDEGRQMSALMQSTLTRFSNLPMITAVLVEGRAIGGGSRADHGSGLPHHGTQLRSPVRPRAHGDHFCVGRHDTANADCWSHIGVGSVCLRTTTTPCRSDSDGLRESCSGGTNRTLRNKHCSGSASGSKELPRLCELSSLAWWLPETCLSRKRCSGRMNSSPLCGARTLTAMP
ncbi:hypothetical protein MRX96_044628 [Rhipicephalus microplus]